MTRPAVASAVTAELYRNNMFRVIGLPIDATSRMVKRRCKELVLADELDLPAPSSTGGRLRLDPPPDQSAVNRAAAAWEDPERRLTDELFWFWGPESPAGNTADPDQAVVSAHDSAVEAHCMALDLELLAKQRALTVDERQRLKERWRNATRGWATVVNDPRTWAHLERRVVEIDDPRLTSRTVADLEQAVPTRLLAINARLALDAVETGDDEVNRQRQVMLNFAREARLDAVVRAEGGVVRNSPSASVDRALNVVAAPTIRRIDDACEEALSAAGDDPRAADTIGIDLQERLHQPLTVVTRLLTLEHPAAQRARDDVASTLRTCAIKHFNEVGYPALDTRVPDFELVCTCARTAMGLLQQAAELASTPKTRDQVAADVAVLEGVLGRITPTTSGNIRRQLHAYWPQLIVSAVLVMILGIALSNLLVFLAGMALFVIAVKFS